MERSPGQKLKDARQEQGLTLEEAAHATRIKEHYLRAIEHGNLEALPSPVQQRGFIRSYASYLGLHEDELLESLSPPAEEPEQVEERRQPEDQTQQPGAEGKFEDIGSTLQEQRQTLGFSLADVERQIHIHQRYLRALEAGRLDDLPSTVQGRGMLKNYAEFMGLDAEALLLKYADGLQQRLQDKQPSQPPGSFPLRMPLWLRRLFSGNLVTGALIVLVLLVTLVWSGMQVFGGAIPEEEGTPTIPGVAEMLLPSATGTITATPSPTAVEPAAGGEGEGGTVATITATLDDQATQLPAVAGNVNIQLIVNQRAYLQVFVDGEEAFNGRVLPGSVHVFDGEERVELLTGNAAAIEVIYNQRDLGVLGLFGEVVNRVYTAEGPASPTPTVSLTPTITPTPTVTPTPENTATATPTPRSLSE